MSSSPPVTRFAPSPTGHLHLGNARTAFLSYLAAHRNGGRYILRSEDTDAARSDDRLLDELIDDLHWLGLEWNEGPDVGGPHAPYRQSERRELYDEWLAKLDAAGLTYPCFCTPVELAVARRSQLAAGQPPRYSGKCRALSQAEREERRARGLEASIRFHVPSGRTVRFLDLVHGEQSFATDDIGDFVIRRADGSAAFFFSNALDDALMGVTLVLRGDDHLANTPRQLLLLEACGLPAPDYAHVALLLGMDGTPLSKRHGDTSLHEFRERGYLPEALCNHLIRLGHSLADERWLDRIELAAAFDPHRLGRAAAKFDEQQLRHWQKEAVGRLPVDRLIAWLGDWLPPHLSDEQRRQFSLAVRPNLEFPQDVASWVQVVFGDIDAYSDEASAAMREAGADFLLKAREIQANAGQDFKSLAKELGQHTGRRGPALYMPLRAALTGMTHGPELAPLFALMSPATVQARFARAHDIASR